MDYSVEVSEPNFGRTVKLTAPTVEEALYMARSWVSKPVQAVPSVGQLIRDCKPKPPTQGIVAQGFEAFGPMGQ